MRILGLILALMFALTVRAQSVMVGANAGIDFDNKSTGAIVKVRLPVHKFEIDAYDTFSPIESHLSLGSGLANLGKISGYVFPAKHFGFGCGIEYSNYNVVHASKGAFYADCGPVFKLMISDFPSRLYFSGTRQVDNGISSNGTESSHLNGAYAELEMLMGCGKHYCVMIDEKLDGGTFLLQSNPVCDGTYGVTGGPNNGPCPRQSGNGGGFSGSIVFKFPRYKGDESTLF